MYEKTQKYVAKVIAETGMDPTKDFLGVTVYDNQFRKEHGVAMIHVRNVDGSRLLAQLNTKEPDNRMVKYGNHKLYFWTKRHRKQEMTVCGTLYEGHTILCSRNPLKVMAALDVLDGKQPGLNANSRLATPPPCGTIVLMRAADIVSQKKFRLRCPVLKDSQWMEVTGGTDNGKSFLKMVVDTQSPEVALNAKGVIDGFVALTRLRHSDRQATTKMLNGLEVSVLETTIVAHWVAAEEDTIEMVKKIRHRTKQHRHKRHQQKKHEKN